MPFLQRDKSGVVIGCFSVRQPGQAEEEVRADAQELLAFDQAMTVILSRPVMSIEDRLAAIEQRLGLSIP